MERPEPGSHWLFLLPHTHPCPSLLCYGPRVTAEFPWALVSGRLWPMRGIGRRRTTGGKETGCTIDCFSPSCPARCWQRLSSSTANVPFRQLSFCGSIPPGASDAMFSSSFGVAMAPCCHCPEMPQYSLLVALPLNTVLNALSLNSFSKNLFTSYFLLGPWLKHY